MPLRRVGESAGEGGGLKVFREAVWGGKAVRGLKSTTVNDLETDTFHEPMRIK